MCRIEGGDRRRGCSTRLGRLRISGQVPGEALLEYAESVDWANPDRA